MKPRFCAPAAQAGGGIETVPEPKGEPHQLDDDDAEAEGDEDLVLGRPRRTSG